MKLDGKQIAENILSRLKTRVDELKKEGINPTLLVILVGNDQQSITYIKQKEIRAAEIGARTEVLTFTSDLSFEEAKKLVTDANSDPLIHGIIIQRPAPDSLKVEELSDLIDPKKEVDGFGKNSPYDVPVAKAVEIFIREAHKNLNTNSDFSDWINKQNIVVIGKGETAGKPIIEHLKKMGISPQIIDSKTPNPKEITNKADILISAVGKDHAVTSDMLKNRAILIGVGLHANDEGKLRGDFHDEEIVDIVSFYSPTPGGVGPVNVACLMANLVNASENLRP